MALCLRSSREGGGPGQQRPAAGRSDAVPSKVQPMRQVGHHCLLQCPAACHSSTCTGQCGMCASLASRSTCTAQCGPSPPVHWVPLAAAQCCDVALGVLHVPDVHVAAHELAAHMRVAVVDLSLTRASDGQEGVTWQQRSSQGQQLVQGVLPGMEAGIGCANWWYRVTATPQAASAASGLQQRDHTGPTAGLMCPPAPSPNPTPTPTHLWGSS
jgi:hypothetical protein